MCEGRHHRWIVEEKSYDCRVSGLLELGSGADALQPPLRCAATRKRDGRTPSKLARASREVPGNRTLWHPGAPTQTCYGVIHSAKLWGQCTKRWEPHPATGSGRMK